MIRFLIRAKDFLRVAECNQDFVAPAPYHMPIEVVSVRVREHQHEEGTPSGVVFWIAAGIVRRNERTTEFEGGRRPTKGCSATKGEMNRQISIESEQMMRTESSTRSVDNERMIILFDSSILQGDCNFVEEFFHFEQRRINNDWSQRPNKEPEKTQKQFITHQRNPTRTGH